jgi:hypothetical protein
MSGMKKKTRKAPVHRIIQLNVEHAACGTSQNTQIKPFLGFLLLMRLSCMMRTFEEAGGSDKIWTEILC